MCLYLCLLLLPAQRFGLAEIWNGFDNTLVIQGIIKVFINRLLIILYRKILSSHENCEKQKFMRAEPRTSASNY